MNAPISYPEPAYRDPPHNFEVEQALLGALMMRNQNFESVADYLRPEHFAFPAHGEIFQAIAGMINTNRPATPVTIKGHFENRPDLEEYGSAGYLMRLAGAAASPRDVAGYGQIVSSLARRRSLIGAGEDLINAAFDTADDATVDEIQERHESVLTSMADTGAISPGLRTFSSFATEALSDFEASVRNRGQITGLATGHADLDRRTGGLRESDLIILAGRPAMGKTALATGIGVAAARAGNPVAFFSLEMSGKQLSSRILSAHAKVPFFKASQGDLQDHELIALAEANTELHSLPIYIDDTGARTVAAMRAEARRMLRKHGLKLVIIDYIGLASPSADSKKANKVHQIEEITTGLKAMAKELKVPVMALCQLSRSLEQREDKRPMLSDLRDSGSIEQDADVVAFVYREQYYLERAEPQKRGDEAKDKYQQRMVNWELRMAEIANKAEVIIAKQRSGPTGTVHMHFDGPLTKFGDLYQQDTAARGTSGAGDWHDR